MGTQSIIFVHVTGQIFCKIFIICFVIYLLTSTITLPYLNISNSQSFFNTICSVFVALVFRSILSSAVLMHNSSSQHSYFILSVFKYKLMSMFTCLRGMHLQICQPLPKRTKFFSKLLSVSLSCLCTVIKTTCLSLVIKCFFLQLKGLIVKNI